MQNLSLFTHYCFSSQGLMTESVGYFKKHDKITLGEYMQLTELEKLKFFDLGVMPGYMQDDILKTRNQFAKTVRNTKSGYKKLVKNKVIEVIPVKQKREDSRTINVMKELDSYYIREDEVQRAIDCLFKDKEEIVDEPVLEVKILYKY